MSGQGRNSSCQLGVCGFLPTVQWEEKKEVPSQAEVAEFRIFGLSKAVSASKKE